MRTTRFFAILVMLTGAVAACSSSSDGGTSRTALMRALAQIADNADTHAQLTFVRPRALRAADNDKNLGVYSRGAELIDASAYSTILPDTLGFDPDTADYAVEAGVAPHLGALLVGLDTGNVAASLTKVGAKRDGDLYRFRPDYQVDLNSGQSNLGGLGLEFNVARIDGSTLRYASAAAGIAQTDASSNTLADNSTVRDLAACLGDPLAALITDRLGHASQPVSPDAPNASSPALPGIDAVAVGYDGKAGSAPTDLMCVAVSQRNQATQLAERIRTTMRTGSTLSSREPWSTLLKNVSVSVHGEVVMVRAEPTNGVAGRFLTLLQENDLPGLN